MNFKLDAYPFSLSENQTVVNATITRVGTFHHPSYGDFSITSQMLSQMVQNFNDKVFGQDIFVDVSHEPEKGAAATIEKLWVENDSLKGSLNLTPYGLSSIKEKGFKYLSAEFTENYKNSETGIESGATLIGAGLTTRPFVKRMEPITLTEKTMTEIKIESEDFAKTLNEILDKREQSLKAITARKERATQLFLSTLGDIDALSDSAKKQLLQEVDAVTSANLADEQVIQLAAAKKSFLKEVISVATDAKIVDQKLKELGYTTPGTPSGNVHIEVDESNHVKALQEKVDSRLGLSTITPQENKTFAEKVLADFDRQNAHKLHSEYKQLTAGSAAIADVSNVPGVLERTVIREALYNLTCLQWVNSGSVPFAPSWTAHYSYRDTAAAGMNSTRVYEGQPIQWSGVKQGSEISYPLPQKLAFQFSNEIRYLTSSSTFPIDWDPIAENVTNAARIIAEDTDRLAGNEIVRATDEFSVTAVTNESITGINGTNKIFCLANFPVVPPRKDFTLAGVQIGSTLNPITLTYDSVVRSEYDGTNTQASGIYYVMNYTMGEFRLVSELGVTITPANLKTCTCSYSYSTNAVKFNTDLGGDAIDVHYDKLLTLIGQQKYMLEEPPRQVAVNFALTTGTIMLGLEQAKQFSANFARVGTDLASNGNLGRVKDVPFYRSTTPGSWIIGRILLGERNNTRFRMMKPWSMGALEEQKDSNGKFVGQKTCYGEQYIGLMTPLYLKGKCSSVVIYSSTDRVARAT